MAGVLAGGGRRRQVVELSAIGGRRARMEFSFTFPTRTVNKHKREGVMRRLWILLAVLTLLAPAGARAQEAEFRRKEDVIYGRKFGLAMTMDVFTPAKPNGRAVVFVVSGGWFSRHESINPAMFGALT